MINRLINLHPTISKGNKFTVYDQMNANASIRDYAIAFLSGMSDTQKARFKKMMENGIECGMSVAKNYNIDYNEFIREVKQILNIEE